MTTVPMDSARLKDMRFDVAGIETVARDVLVMIPYTFPRRTEITVTTDEFTAVCPWSGLPDYAKLTVRYLPGVHYVELKSFKYYVSSFRNVGIFQEDATNVILEHLVEALDPLFIEVQLDYNVRGGFHTVTRAQHHRSNNDAGADLASAQPVISNERIDWATWREEQANT
jgi:7-cyano-7-deazaguanine reductase